MNKRKPLSEEHKKKISEALKGKLPKNIAMIAGWNKDKKTGLIPKSAFKKDHTPWNKDFKGYENAGTFKIGHKLSNTGKTHFPKGLIPWNKGKRNLPKCLDCNKELSNYRSKRCKKHAGGKNHYLWKGTTPINKSIRNTARYAKWRKAIFERDDYTCQICDKKGGNLVVDHYPIALSKLIEKYNIKTIEDAFDCDILWNINNNRTLCNECHLETDNFGKKQSPITSYIRNINVKDVVEL